MSITHLLNAPWAVLPDRLPFIRDLLMHGGDDHATMRGPTRGPQASAAPARATPAASGSIAVLRLYGVLVPRASDFAEQFGLAGVQRFTQDFRAALADDSIGGILIDVDSPGGSVYGVMELANEIYQARSQKPIFAVANSLAASAAFWVASSASEFFVTTGGEVGSIGVADLHTDVSGALNKVGISMTLVSAGKYKTEGNSFGPLTGEARAAMQTRIDAYYGAFTRNVARNRNVDVSKVRNGMGEGRTLSAQAARSENMVDGVATLDEVVNRLARRIGQPSSGPVRASVAPPSGTRAAARQRLIERLSL
ncbi:S49 family peptidase [Paraburkholderia elongata]|uniref:S49 family peptidase n=1 Tax=Paraburkholderia elongata TaxID=2675747 RepID=A0A972NZB9_9BURK|nr:S49 family peptidase [Paraburkholderia elongata]NPT61204.1 S49 family peptidase [Paraburkholderia elongata]